MWGYKSFGNSCRLSQSILQSCRHVTSSPSRIVWPRREEIWRQLARGIGANYVDGNFWNRCKVRASHAGLLITLSEHGKYHHTCQTKSPNTLIWVLRDAVDVAVRAEENLTVRNGWRR